MRRKQELSRLAMMWWTTVGIGSGLAAGFALSEWVGGVSRLRVRRAAARIRQRSPARVTPAAAARAVQAALLASPDLGPLSLRASPAGRSTVELHGWVPSRASRALARRTALSVPGVERVINSILVRGEDDRPSSGHASAADLPA